MIDFSDELERLKTWIEGASSAFLEHLPDLLLSLLILLLGWGLAKILRGSLKKTSRWANRRLDGMFTRGQFASARIPDNAIAILSFLAFWLVLFLSAVIAAKFSGFITLSAWLDKMATHLPNLVVGASIILFGYVLSDVVGDQVTASARRAKSSQSVVLGRFVQAVIFGSALIIGLDKVGVYVTFLVALFAVASGAALVGFALAFGLGAQTFVRDLVSARDLARTVTQGVKIRIGETQGEVLEITQTRIVIETLEGRVLIPASKASLETISILSAGHDGAEKDV